MLVKEKGVKIGIDELSKILYQYHIDNKNYRIARILRCFILQENFQDVLKEIRKRYIKNPKTKKVSPSSKDFFYKIENFISQYTKEVSYTKYFNKQNRKFQNDYFCFAQRLIFFLYVNNYENHSKSSTPLSKKMLIHTVNNKTKDLDLSEVIWTGDTMMNNINIDHVCEYRFIIEQGLPPTDHNQKEQNNLPEHIKECEVEASNNLKLINTELFESEKICQLFIYENAGKNEVLDYINNNWERISGELRSNRPSIDEQRLSADKNLLRDIEIFNFYQNQKNLGVINPDIVTRRWLKDESPYKIDVDPTSVRKITSALNTDLKSLRIQNTKFFCEK